MTGLTGVYEGIGSCGLLFSLIYLQHFCISKYVASMIRQTVNYELERSRKEAIMIFWRYRMITVSGLNDNMTGEKDC